MRHALLLALAASAAVAAPSDRFTTRWRAGTSVEGADDGRFAAIGGKDLRVALDSNAPASRLVAPLGMTLDATTSFRLDVRLTLLSVDASPDDFFQIAFGLVHRGVTGLDRTGTALPGPPFFVDDSDTFDAVELDYYANVTAFGGPFLVPTAFGPARGSAFANFAANFGPSADLGDNGPGEITELPLGRPIDVVMTYDACTGLLVTRIFDARGAELATGLQPLDLRVLDGGFTVDALAISAYQDLADFDPSTVSLRADVAFGGATVERLPEHGAILLPRVVNADAHAPAHVRLTGGAGAPSSVRLVESGGAATDVPLDVRGDLADVPRALAVAPMALDVDGCRVEVR